MKRTVLFTYRNVNDTSVKSYLVTRARNVASMQTCVKTTITRISNSRRRECTQRTYTIGLEDNVKNRFLAGRTRNPLFRILKRKGGDSLEGIVRWGEEREHNGRKKNNGVARWRTIDDTACVYIYISPLYRPLFETLRNNETLFPSESLSLSLSFFTWIQPKKSDWEAVYPSSNSGFWLFFFAFFSIFLLSPLSLSFSFDFHELWRNLSLCADTMGDVIGSSKIIFLREDWKDFGEEMMEKMV